MSAEDLPVVLLLFANDRHGDAAGYLRDLVAERHAITRALGGVAGRAIELVVEPNTTATALFDLLDAHHDRVVGLHYGGHASGDVLHLEDAEGRPAPVYRDGLAERIGALPALRWVFLNGCATRAHVAALHTRCRAPVIATERAIADDVATSFAQRFYTALAGGASIGEAFDRAAAAGRAQATPEQAWRMARPAGRVKRPDDATWPWMLHRHPDAPTAADWRIERPRRWPRWAAVAAAAAAAAAVVAWALWPADPPTPPVVDRPAPPLAVEGVQASKLGVSFEVSGVAPADPIDATLAVQCGEAEGVAVPLVERVPDDGRALRRSFRPVVAPYEALLPDPSCGCTIEVKAADGRRATVTDACRTVSPEAYFVVYDHGAAADRSDPFRVMLDGARATVSGAAHEARGRAVEMVVREDSTEESFGVVAARRLAAVGRLVLVVWRETDLRSQVSRVFTPFDDLAAAFGEGGSLITVRHLPSDPGNDFYVAQLCHVLMLHAALAVDARERGERAVEVAHLRAALNARRDLARELGAVREADRAVAGGLEAQSAALAAALERRMAAIGAEGGR